MAQVTNAWPRLRLTVLGAGYLGLAHAACMADLGFEVLGMDADAGRIDALSRGELPFFEPGLQVLLRRGLESRRLRFTTSYSEVAAFGDVHFVCVGTPQRVDTGGADLSQLNACLSTLAPLLRRNRMIDLVKKVLGGSVTGRAVSILGLSFKPDSDDIRDSPALAVAKAVHGLGANVTVYDPVAMVKVRKECPGLVYAGSVIEAAHKSEVILMLTEWAEFGEADPEILGKAVARRNIVDGRNALDSRPWRAAGWNFYALGRPSLTSVS